MNPFPIQENKQCGPYVTWFVLRRLKSTAMTPKEVVKAMPWKVPFHGTLPWGIKVVLVQNGLSAHEQYLHKKTCQERHGWTKEVMGRKRLLIILGQQNYQQHYVVVFNYDVNADQYLVYDPLIGETNWSPHSLFAFWSGGGLFGLFRWYAIEVS